MCGHPLLLVAAEALDQLGLPQLLGGLLPAPAVVAEPMRHGDRAHDGQAQQEPADPGGISWNHHGRAPTGPSPCAPASRLDGHPESGAGGPDRAVRATDSRPPGLASSVVSAGGRQVPGAADFLPGRRHARRRGDRGSACRTRQKSFSCSAGFAPADRDVRRIDDDQRGRVPGRPPAQGARPRGGLPHRAHDFPPASRHRSGPQALVLRPPGAPLTIWRGRYP